MPRATVRSVAGYERRPDGVRLECSVTADDGEPSPEDTVTLPDRTVPVTIRFLSPAVFRFELEAAPEAGDGTTALDLDEAAVAEPVEVAVTETGDQLRLETAALTVEVGLAEWSFAVHDADGRRLLAEQRADVNAKAERRAAPLGYTHELTNRWPYRLTDAGTAFVLEADEHVYGLGETFGAHDKRGETVDCWVTQPNGAETDHSYKAVPFHLSSKGYGLLVDTDQRVTYDVGDTSTVSTTVSVDDDRFAFVFVGGPDLRDVLERYTALTGRPGTVPRWSYGVWYSRMGYESRTEVESVLDRLEAADLPVDVVHLDPPWLDGLCTLRWDTEAFPDPEGFIEGLHDRGVRLCLWEYPYLLTRTDAYEEAADRGLLVEDGTGKPYLLDRISWSSDRGAILDLTDPAAREWWTDRHAELLAMGVDAFKCDFGEYLPPDAVLADGSTGRTARNRYPNRYARTAREAMAAAGTDPLLWTRSGWAGGQRYPVHWGGDPATSFEAMGSSLRGGLALACSGYGFWAADIGGFRGEPTTELYCRWAQLALMGNSHARFHGTTPREPWHYDPPATEVVRRYSEERYRLLPYLETLGRVATERGLPVMRPPVLEFQTDHGARTCDDQVLLGPGLLVAPVLTSGGEVAVYLPPGEWVGYWSGERVRGGRTVQRAVDLTELPVYLRAGHLHPRTALERADPETRPDRLRVRGALADGTASGEVLDPVADELRTVTAERTGDRLVLAAGLAVPTGLELEGVTEPPATVVVDGHSLERATADGGGDDGGDRTPAPGTWTYDAERGRVTALPPGF